MTDSTHIEVYAGDACVMAGISHRELGHWISVGGFVATGRTSTGTGDRRTFTMHDIERLRAIKARRQWGMSLEAAMRTVDPPLPAPPLPAKATA